MPLTLKSLHEQLAEVDPKMPVVVRDGQSLYFVHTVEKSAPMVRWNGAHGPFVSGRRNATRYACVEANVAFYPSIREARSHAMTVGMLRAAAGQAGCESQKVLARSGFAGAEPAYRFPSWLGVLRIAPTGRPEPVSRGGVDAFCLMIV